MKYFIQSKTLISIAPTNNFQVQIPKKKKNHEPKENGRKLNLAEENNT